MLVNIVIPPQSLKIPSYTQAFIVVLHCLVQAMVSCFKRSWTSFEEHVLHPYLRTYAFSMYIPSQVFDGVESVIFPIYTPPPPNKCSHSSFNSALASFISSMEPTPQSANEFSTRTITQNAIFIFNRIFRYIITSPLA